MTEGKKEEKKEKKTGVKGSMDIDLGFGGLFKGIEGIVNMASKLQEAGGEITKEGNIDLSHLKEGMKGVFGFSLKTLAGGKTIVESFGNIKETPKGPTVEEEREPITDVFDETDEIKIYAEIPGVNQENIKLELKEDILNISTKNGGRYKFHKEVLLPAKGNVDKMTSDYKNGVLEVTIKKT